MRKRISLKQTTISLIYEVSALTGEGIEQSIRKALEMRLLELKQQKLIGITKVTHISETQDDDTRNK